jgi:hypothetical protein
MKLVLSEYKQARTAMVGGWKYKGFSNGFCMVAGALQ